MKYNVKEHVNVIDTVDSFIAKLNEYSINSKQNKVYDLSIKKGVGKSKYRPNEKDADKPFVTLLFTVADATTRERITLFSVDYVFNDVKDRFKGMYKKVLYLEFLNSVVLGYAIQIENVLKRQNIEKAITINEKLAGQSPAPSNKGKDEDIIKASMQV